MLSLSSHYALRAVIYIARHEEDCPIPGREVAEGAAIPRKYLLKILGDLVRERVLVSTRGKAGGFCFKSSAKQTKLIDVLRPFEYFDDRQCPFGNQECGDENPCLAHDRWTKVQAVQLNFFKKTSVLDVAVAKSISRSRKRPARE